MTRAEVAATARIAVALELMDPMGFVAARLPGSRQVAITPGYAAAGELGRLRPDDVATLDENGAQVGGSYPAPAEAPLAVALLRSLAAPSAVIYGSPASTMTLGAVGRSPLPLTHTNAELVHGGIQLLRPPGMVVDRNRAESLARRLGSSDIGHLVGMGVVARAPGPFEALRRLDSLELMSRLTVATLALTDEPPSVSAEQAAAISGSRPHEPTPSRDPVRYYRSLDPGSRHDTLADRCAGSADPTDLHTARAQLAASARILSAAGGLVAFFEHVSQRVPGYDDRFVMTAAHDFSQMTSDDVGVVGMTGDCDPIECRYPPAPFRWLHRDLLMARRDVNAIVHTHPLYGRAYALSGRPPVAWHRDAALAPTEIPTLRRPSLLFAEVDRRELLDLLGAGPAVHALHHGTDFVAARIQEATVAAVRHEASCRNDHAIIGLGDAKALPAQTLSDLREHGPSASQWWDFLASKLPATCNTGGLR